MGASQEPTRLEEDERRAFVALLRYILYERGVDCSQYKERFLHRRLAVRMRACGVGTYREYLAVLRSHPGEIDQLLAALSINMSRFFRDGPVFDALRYAVLAPLLAERNRAGQRHIRVWSAGCADGEEPYSVAMILKDLLDREFSRWEIVIHGTDVEKAALARARQGVYRAVSFRDLQADYVARYFVRHGDRYVLDPEIRKAVTFRYHDLMTAQPASEYDLILCRNVLIYFARQHHSPLLRRLLAALRPGGHLVLGMVEVIPLDLIAAGQLEAVDGRLRIYRKRM